MARYRTTVGSSRTAEDAFDYLAEFSHAAEWDPGVVEGESLDGPPVRTGSRFRLLSRVAGRSVPLEYRVVALERPHRVVLQADQRALRSTDEIRFAAVDGRTEVTYEADLRLKGRLGRILDPLLTVAFRRIGDRAAAGLRRALNP